MKKRTVIKPFLNAFQEVVPMRWGLVVEAGHYISEWSRNIYF